MTTTDFLKEVSDIKVRVQLLKDVKRLGEKMTADLTKAEIQCYCSEYQQTAMAYGISMRDMLSGIVTYVKDVQLKALIVSS